jgi:uncharacterized protein with von Willebrand factor type A (vWA) domain
MNFFRCHRHRDRSAETELEPLGRAPGALPLRRVVAGPRRSDARRPPRPPRAGRSFSELARRFKAYLSRRQRMARCGRLDIRRTLRRAVGTGGVPIDPAFRERRPGRPDLIALCDHSHSVAVASRFFVSLIAPARDFFRRQRLFAYVDRAVEISLEGGHIVPHDTLDLYARSDFGNVLLTFYQRYESLLTRNAILLVLGDARNNRRPPRADVLARFSRMVRQVVWLNPEAQSRWNTGDSAMQAYAAHCELLLAASNLRQLQRALEHAFRAL